MDINDATFVELLEFAKAKAIEARDNPAGQHTGGAREIALAITEIENAQMRYTRGLAVNNGHNLLLDLEQTDPVNWDDAFAGLDTVRVPEGRITNPTYS